MKNKLILLISVFAITFSTVKAQDADCPCWGEKKAFVAEVYSFNGIGKVPSVENKMRIMVVPGISAGYKFNKKNTFMIGINYTEINTIYDAIFCDMYPCYDCHDYKFIELLFEWRYRTLWKTNFSSDIFTRAGPGVEFYSKDYYKYFAELNRKSDKLFWTNTIFTAGYNLNFKMNKHFTFSTAPFFQYNFGWSPIHVGLNAYNYFFGLKAGLKYSKYLK